MAFFALKRDAAPSGFRLKVSEKGAVSVYGMGRFPVTLYKEQWLKLLEMSDDIRAFRRSANSTRQNGDLKRREWLACADRLAHHAVRQDDRFAQGGQAA